MHLSSLTGLIEIFSHVHRWSRANTDRMIFAVASGGWLRYTFREIVTSVRGNRAAGHWPSDCGPLCRWRRIVLEELLPLEEVCRGLLRFGADQAEDGPGLPRRPLRPTRGRPESSRRRRCAAGWRSGWRWMGCRSGWPPRARCPAGPGAAAADRPSRQAAGRRRPRAAGLVQDVTVHRDTNATVCHWPPVAVLHPGHGLGHSAWPRRVRR